MLQIRRHPSLKHTPRGHSLGPTAIDEVLPYSSHLGDMKMLWHRLSAWKHQLQPFPWILSKNLFQRLHINHGLTINLFLNI